MYYSFIRHSFPLTHFITGSSTTLLLQEHLCCVIITESSCLVQFWGPCREWLTIKRQKLRWHHSLGATKLSSPVMLLHFFFFFFFIADPTRIDACWVRTSKNAPEVKCCSPRSIYLHCEVVFYAPFYCLQSRSNLLLSWQVKKHVLTTEQLPIHCPDSETQIFCNHSTV